MNAVHGYSHGTRHVIIHTAGTLVIDYAPDLGRLSKP